jgi:hypothetical protein
MQSFDIHPGQAYGYRDTPKHRDELQRVKVLEKVRGKWKVEWCARSLKPAFCNH